MARKILAGNIVPLENTLLDIPESDTYTFGVAPDAGTLGLEILERLSPGKTTIIVEIYKFEDVGGRQSQIVRGKCEIGDILYKVNS